jgi:hypothetical protein
MAQNRGSEAGTGVARKAIARSGQTLVASG